MKARIKAAWLERLTPSWWQTRAVGRLKNEHGQMCANGALCDMLDSTRWEGGQYRFPNGEVCGAFPLRVNRAIRYSERQEGDVVRANDTGTYADLLAAVHAIPTEE